MSCANEEQRLRTKAATNALPDSIVELQLQDGDLICRLGDSWYSGYLRKIASKGQKYSHVGILIREAKGNDIVYHCEYDETAGHNGIVAEQLSDFVGRAIYVGAYRLPIDSLKRQRLRKAICSYIRTNPPFDLAFDSMDASQLYCTEFVVRVLHKAGISGEINPSGKLRGRLFYTIDDALGSASVVHAP